MTAPELTHAQQFAIAAAADEAYDKLRCGITNSRTIYT